MKSVGKIYRKYRQLKRYIIYNEIKEAFQRKHCNCIYGKTLSYKDKNGVNKTIYICTYDKIDIEHSMYLETCYNPQECMAFAYKSDKNAIKDRVIKKLNNSTYVKNNYPELAILEWILEDTTLYEKHHFIDSIKKFFNKIYKYFERK